MIQKSLKDVETLSNGSGLFEKYEDIIINGVSTDTRTIEAGNLFIPLLGDNFDGHKFLNKAIDNGACATLWNKNIKTPDIDFPFILVDDTLEGLQDLARNYRLSLDLKIIGITGSNGKTTTKDIIDGVISRKYKTQKTLGNLNNQIGLPLTLLELEEDTQVGIIEMGTDGFGQIETLTRIARPDYAVITNIGDSHLQDLGSKENVARAKFEILDGLNPEGKFIYNHDDEILNKIILEFNPEDTITFGTSISDYTMKIIEQTNTNISFSVNNRQFTLPMIGIHNMYNATIAIILADLLKLDDSLIQEGFYNINKTGMRNEILQSRSFEILNDAYKSNPNSLLAALETLYSLKGYSNKYVVLGDMLELGEDEIELHISCGNKINPSEIDMVFTYGDLGKHIGEGALENFDYDKVLHFNDKNILAQYLTDNLEDNSIVLIKGSRSLQLEDVIEQLI